MQSRSVASLEERCVSLKSTIDQMNMALERASAGESELKAEIQALHRSLMDASSSSQSGAEKLKHVSSFCYVYFLAFECEFISAAKSFS